jgi:archaellum biogenesis ATPase FlaH
MSLKINIPDIIKKYNFSEIISKRVGYDERYTPGVPVLEIDGVRVLTKGNVSLIQAQPKAGKTASALILMKKILSGTPDFKISLFDTEQERNDCVWFMSALKKMTPCFKQVDIFPLRLYSHDIRLEFVSDYIEKYKPDVVFIDNIRDCMVSINSEDQSHYIRTVISQIAEHNRCHIIMTLHENPGSEKARGHIGTELCNQVETAFRIVHDDDADVFTIKRVMTRRKKFSDILFQRDENGVPFEISNFSSKKSVF